MRGRSYLEGTLTELSSLLLELLDGTRVDTTALVDQVTSGGGLAGIDVADNDDVNVSLVCKRMDVSKKRYSDDRMRSLRGLQTFFTHGGGVFSQILQLEMCRGM